MKQSKNKIDDNSNKSPYPEDMVESKKNSDRSAIDAIQFDFDFRPVARSTRKNQAIETHTKESNQDIIPLIAHEYSDSIASFSSLMCYLLEYMKQVGGNSVNSIQTNWSGMYRVFIEMLFDAKQNRKKTDTEVVLRFSTDDNPDPVEVILPLVDEDKLRSILQYHEAAVAAPKILSESMIQQIMNAWENLLKSLLETKIDANTLKSNSNIQLSYSEIAGCKDIHEIKQRFTEKLLRKFLGGNIEEQLATLNTDYKIDFSSAFGNEHLTDLKAIIALRHAIVHCNSIASSEYCEKVKKLGKQEPKVGTPLFLTGQELFHAWDIFFAAGMIVSLLFQINHARQLKSPKMEAAAFSTLVVESHNALEQNRNEAALIMLQYANTLSIRSEWPRLATKINLALSYKRMGLIQECNRVLGECDWNTCDDQFKAVVAALRGNNKDALKLIFKLCRKDDNFIKSVNSWVVFEDVRRDKAFAAGMQKLLSKKGKQMVQVLAPAVHFSQETDANAMLTKLYKAALKFKLGEL